MPGPVLVSPVVTEWTLGAGCGQVGGGLVLPGVPTGVHPWNWSGAGGGGWRAGDWSGAGRGTLAGLIRVGVPRAQARFGVVDQQIARGAGRGP